MFEFTGDDNLKILQNNRHFAHRAPSSVLYVVYVDIAFPKQQAIAG